MAVGIVDRQKLVNIADAVRAKKGITGNMTLDAIASNITSMPTADNNAKFDFAGSGSKSSGDLRSYLTTVDLSGWDTSNVIDMSGMFQDCRALKNIDVSGFNTSKVTKMRDMFSSCFSLTTLDLRGWDTSNVQYMENMFYSCSSLTTLDVSGFDTSKATNMDSMFIYCRELSNLTLGTNWASNSSISSFHINYCPLTRESAVDVINKLATRSNSPVIAFSKKVGLYQSEIDVATNKGWSVSGCGVLVDAETATVGQYAIIDGEMAKCVYVADTPQAWGQRVFTTLSHFKNSNEVYRFQWGGYGTETGIRNYEIGNGLSNTNALIAMNLQSTDGTPTVWDAITEFRSTHSDRWFVPCRDEVALLKEGEWSDTGESKWSSSEYDTSSNNLVYVSVNRPAYSRGVSKELLYYLKPFTYV